MTVAELKFLETVPVELRDIARELKEIKEELKKLNSPPKGDKNKE